MNEEKYSNERAQEEAEALQKMVESGEVSGYEEAEQRIEPIKKRAEKIRKRDPLEIAQNPDVYSRVIAFVSERASVFPENNFDSSEVFQRAVLKELYITIKLLRDDNLFTDAGVGPYGREESLENSDILNAELNLLFSLFLKKQTSARSVVCQFLIDEYSDLAVLEARLVRATPLFDEFQLRMDAYLRQKYSEENFDIDAEIKEIEHLEKMASELYDMISNHIKRFVLSGEKMGTILDEKVVKLDITYDRDDAGLLSHVIFSFLTSVIKRLNSAKTIANDIKNPAEFDF